MKNILIIRTQRAAHIMNISALVVVLFLSSGCATIIHGGTTQEVPIRSNPSGVKAKVAGKTITTPGTVTLKRDQDYMVTFYKEGYRKKRTSITSDMSSLFWGNCLLGGIIGMGVDYIGGGGYELNPEEVFVSLRKERETKPQVQVKAIKREKEPKPARKPKKKFKANVLGQKWAVVAGVSKYKHAGNNKITNLRYADRDAEAMAEFLKSPKGGGFDNVYVIINEEVTYKNMRYALFNFLAQAIEEDMVLFFFAGHGAPDPNAPDNLYLLTYDTDPEDVSTTAFPMWDVETALKRYIKAETVVMLTDACHSGGVNPSFGTRGITVENNPTNDAILKLAHIPGMISITASESREVSHESKKWGGGHGVFTHFLLEGLKGKADRDEDRIISLGEMIDYTSEHVRRATRSKQHPDVSGNFDRNMPMSILK